MRSVFSFTYESYQVLISLPICWFELIFQSWFNKNDTLPWSHYSESLSLRHQSCKISCWARDLYSPAALHWMTPHCYLWHWWSKIEAKSKQSDRMSVMGPTDRSHLGISMRNSPETQHLDPIHHSDLTSRMYSVWLTLYFGEIRITFFLHLRTLAVRKGNLWGQMQWPGCLWGYVSIVWKESTAKNLQETYYLLHRFRYFLNFDFILPIRWPNNFASPKNKKSQICGDFHQASRFAKGFSGIGSLISRVRCSLCLVKGRSSKVAPEFHGVWWSRALVIWRRLRLVIWGTMHNTYLDVFGALALNVMLLSHCAHSNSVCWMSPFSCFSFREIVSGLSWGWSIFSTIASALQSNQHFFQLQWWWSWNAAVSSKNR